MKRREYLKMESLSVLAVLCFVLSITMGCSTTSKEGKAAAKAEYFEDGKMDDQVDSWKKHGRY